MSNILSKISSIEAVDDVKGNAVPEPSTTPKSSRKSIYDDGIDIRNAPETTKVVPAEPSEPVQKPALRWVGLTISLAITLWVLTALLVAYMTVAPISGLSQISLIQMIGYGLFILGPVLIIIIFGYTLRQLAQLSDRAEALSKQANAISASSQALMTPDETALSRTAVMSYNMKREIDQVDVRIDKALSRMSKLKDTLEEQLQAIDHTAYLTENKTELIARQLSEERQALTEIASTYDNRMAALSENLDMHSANLAKSTKEAEQRINEARISVEGAAAKINSASEIVRQNTEEAASKLETNQLEIARLGGELKNRALELDQVYSKHAADLSSMISDLRNEQETLAASLEAGLKKMREMSLTAQVSANHLTDASTSGRKTVEALANAARLTDTAVKQRFADMEDMVRFSNARAESIAEKAARRVQDSLAQTRKEISRIEYDMVELQDRLQHPKPKAAPAENRDEALPTPQEKANPAPRKRGILGLKPLPDSEAEIEPQRPSRSDEDLTEVQHAPQKKRLSGLRPAPDPAEEFIAAEEDFDLLPQPDDSDLSIPESGPTTEHDGEIDIHDLVLEAPDIEDLAKTQADQELLNYDPDFTRPGAESLSPSHKILLTEQKRKSWWKNLFSGGQDEPEQSPLDILTAPSKELPIDVTDKMIVARLSAIGLAPGAVVDDGCIIEAVNTRISRGPLAMSDVITNRLEDPVRHLYDKAAHDEDLKAEMTAFARRFHSNLGPIEDDREAVRSRLESDAGRAFLLCDAALNR